MSTMHRTHPPQLWCIATSNGQQLYYKLVLDQAVLDRLSWLTLADYVLICAEMVQHEMIAAGAAVPDLVWRVEQPLDWSIA